MSTCMDHKKQIPRATAGESDGPGGSHGPSRPLRTTVEDRYREIGSGQCGRIYTLPVSSNLDGRVDAKVVKVFNPLFLPRDGLYNDWQYHLATYATFTRHGITPVRIPKAHAYHSPLIAHQAFWSIHTQHFPADKYKDLERQPATPNATQSYKKIPTSERVVVNPVLISERIYPLPSPLRSKLINLFCPPSLAAEVRGSRKDEDCLVRLYLGRRGFSSSSTTTLGTRKGGRVQTGFTLRNFGLTLSRIETMELEEQAVQWAGKMGQALGGVHWGAGHDAWDVEFVLGLPPASSCCGPREIERLEDATMWLIDFNRCNAMTYDEAGVDQAVESFYFNDPYYPRPRPGSKQLTGNERQLEDVLWDAFVEAYLDTSERILEARIADGALEDIVIVRALPRAFIDGLIRQWEAQKEKKRIAALRSAGDFKEDDA